jgi:uncharacterized protein
MTMRDALRHVLYYESGDLSLAAEHFPAHQATYAGFFNRGVLLALGPFTDRGASMAIFTTREAAEEFAEADPFVLHGVVGSWHVREWRAVTPD